MTYAKLIFFTALFGQTIFCQSSKLCDNPDKFVDQILLIIDQEPKSCLLTKDLDVYRFERQRSHDWRLNLSQVTPVQMEDLWPVLYLDGIFSESYNASFVHTSRIYSKDEKSELLFMYGKERGMVEILSYELDAYLNTGAKRTGLDFWTNDPGVEYIFRPEAVWVAFSDDSTMNLMQVYAPSTSGQGGWQYNYIRVDTKKRLFYPYGDPDVPTKYLCRPASDKMMFSFSPCPKGQEWRDKIHHILDVRDYYSYLFGDERVFIYYSNATYAPELEHSHNLTIVRYAEFLGCTGPANHSINPKAITESGSKTILVVGIIMMALAVIIVALLLVIWCMSRGEGMNNIKSSRKSPQTKKISAKKERVAATVAPPNQSAKKGGQQSSRSNKKAAPDGGSSKKKKQ